MRRILSSSLSTSDRRRRAGGSAARSLVAAVLAVSLAACGGGGGDGGGGGSAFDDIKEAGVIKVGYANEAPYAYQQGGELTGTAMELLKAFFAEHDVEVEGEVVEFAGLIPGLEADRYDIVGAGMYILPERCEIANFGPPEYQMNTAFAVARGNPLGITSYQDVVDSDAVYATSSGVAEIEYAEVAGVPEDRIKIYPSYADAAAALGAGRVDVMAQQQMGLKSTLEALDSDRVEYVDLTEPPIDVRGNPAVGYGGTVFPKESEDLREAYTEWLAQAREDGSYQEIMAEFGFGPDNIPPADLTAEDLCSAE
ncbi:transporter substrate-binding domain-containing protein [Nocardioides bigeumensis]|uniref:Ectoine/hydroxyectoine ABC transporter substrate-binding protein EhuB n=1 Tax=Nocardioides bigeumensis TaxID=433657 RepID=A0ABN2YQ22_9ACTN